MYIEKNKFQSKITDEIVKNGITRKDILGNHYKVYGRMLDSQQLRMEIIPMLETSGLIYEESDLIDKRKKLIFLSAFFDSTEQQNNSGDGRGVNLSEDNKTGLDEF